jgi:hypothetical protein
MTVIHLTPLVQDATERVAADATLIARASFPYLVDGAAVVVPQQLRFDFKAGQPSPVVELDEPDGFAWLLHLKVGSWVQARAVMWLGAELDWAELTDVNPATLTSEGAPSMPTGQQLITREQVDDLFDNRALLDAATYVAVQPTAPDPTKITAWVDNTTSPPTVKGWNGTAWVAIGGGGGGGAVSSVAGRTGAVTLTKTDVSLGNVDNTADASKPISTAQATVNAAKADLVGGLVPTSQIPALALNTSFTVASQAAMLALTTTQVQPGDLAIRTDGAGTFILTATDPSQLGNWVRLNAPTDAVTTVNGQQGTVVLGATPTSAPRLPPLSRQPSPPSRRRRSVSATSTTRPMSTSRSRRRSRPRSTRRRRSARTSSTSAQRPTT